MRWSLPDKIRPVDVYTTAVSYTHLDVYKRQTLEALRPPKTNQNGIHYVKPVSYTHLDVYKRQDIC